MMGSTDIVPVTHDVVHCSSSNMIDRGIDSDGKHGNSACDS